MWSSSLLSVTPVPSGSILARDIKKVPFVELYNGRVQGVVSSGSDIRRVYVAFFEIKTLDFYCSTNNNRPCGGLRGSPCKHLQLMMRQAVVQYGLEPVVRFLQITDDPSQMQEHEIFRHTGGLLRDPANEVFSRFLNYLAYLELEGSDRPVNGMSWFGG